MKPLSNDVKSGMRIQDYTTANQQYLSDTDALERIVLPTTQIIEASSLRCLLEVARENARTHFNTDQALFKQVSAVAEPVRFFVERLNYVAQTPRARGRLAHVEAVSENGKKVDFICIPYAKDDCLLGRRLQFNPKKYEIQALTPSNALLFKDRALLLFWLSQGRGFTKHHAVVEAPLPVAATLYNFYRKGSAAAP